MFCHFGQLSDGDSAAHFPMNILQHQEFANAQDTVNSSHFEYCALVTDVSSTHYIQVPARTLLWPRRVVLRNTA